MGNDAAEIGKRIGQLRRELGVQEKVDVDRAELARRIGVNASSVTRWEKGLRVPDSSNLVDLARVLHTTAEFLLHGPADTKKARGKRAVAKVVDKKSREA